MTTPTANHRPQGSRTAVAIDAAIRRVLNDRKRAKEFDENSDPTSAFDSPDSLHSRFGFGREEVTWDDVNVSDESPSTTSDEAKPKGWRRTAIKSSLTSGMTNLRQNTQSVLGKSDSYERGFILSAGFIVVVMTVLRLIGMDSPAFGMGISAVVMGATLGPCIWRGIEMKQGSKLQDNTFGSVLACVACSPIFTRMAGASLSHASKTSLWVSWVGVWVGMVAFLTTLG